MMALRSSSVDRAKAPAFVCWACPFTRFCSSHDPLHVERPWPHLLPTGSSVAVRADDLAIGLGAEGPPRGLVDRILDKPNAAVGHEYVHAAGVVALGLGELALVVLVRRVGAPGPGIHLGVRR